MNRSCLILAATGLMSHVGCTKAEVFAGPIVVAEATGPLDVCDREALLAEGGNIFYPFQSRAPTPLTFESGLYRFDDAGVLMYDYGKAYGGLGWAYNPMFIARHALGLAVDRAAETTPVPERERQLRAQLDWLVENGTERQTPVRHHVWTYPFPVEKFYMPAGWSSGLAQARIAVAMQYGFAEFGDERYCLAAQGALAAMNITTAVGGVATKTAEDAVWFEEYAHPGAPSTLVLNGHLSALAGLHVLRSEVAARLFDAGVRSTAALLPKFDAGFLSRYSLYPDWLAPAAGYNVMHAYQLSWLYDVAPIPAFAAAAMRYLDYADDGGYATAVASVNAETHGPDRLNLSLGSSYWSGPMPAHVTWHLDATGPTEGIDVVGYFLKPSSLPRDLTAEVEGPDGTREVVGALTGNEAPWFRMSWTTRETSRIHLHVSRSSGWSATALFGLRAVHSDRRTGFLPSYGLLRNTNLPAWMTTEAGWQPPGEEGWVLIRPVAKEGTLVVSPCPAGLGLDWSAGKSLDAMEPVEVAPAIDDAGCRFESPRGDWLKFEFEGAVKRPVFRWTDARGT